MHPSETYSFPIQFAKTTPDTTKISSSKLSMQLAYIWRKNIPFRKHSLFKLKREISEGVNVKALTLKL
jgi:hypothetical protein